jgi:hypothetical protein
MKVSRSEGLANHTGPESCGAAREDGVEALTGEGAGRVFSRETYKLRNADALRAGGRHNRIRHYREALPSSARSQTPSTYRTLERSHESTNRKQFLVRCLPARPASAFGANADEQQELSRRAASTRTGWNHGPYQRRDQSHATTLPPSNGPTCRSAAPWKACPVFLVP